ncbi:helix-turn-helix transcriptional regulator [uncultured Pseudoteredinibacter sp.]|uniref:helix-turn-helix domain-containing protein n=1 Tax=uncultured Pseudoteredinibacter sp. TaxID=1641701 RepID=UPI002610C9AF|nr:helix-turn-helix transcriptional regulator [uncultured Pseudoteredinibacter sp.]
MKKAITSERYRQLCLLFKKRRLELGISMRAMGERINEPHSVIQKVESNQRKLDIFQFVQYCEALGLDPSETLKVLKGNNI